MYLSHPVRRMRDDPREGESVTLIVSVDDSGRINKLEADIERIGGTVEKRMRFGALRVEISQEQVDDICSIEGIGSIETANTIGINGDAGEDVT